MAKAVNEVSSGTDAEEAAQQAADAIARRRSRFSEPGGPIAPMLATAEAP